MELRRRKKKLLRMERMMMKGMKKVEMSREGWAAKTRKEAVEDWKLGWGGRGGLCSEPPNLPK